MIRSLLVSVLLIAAAGIASAQCTSTCGPDKTQASGAKYRICLPEPSCYRGEVVLYAHGYVSPFAPIAIPEDQLVFDGTSLPAIINGLGYGFAVTSYSKNGLAVKEAELDLDDLVNLYKSEVGPVSRVFLAGVSEGGIITARQIERKPQIYNGGVAACGPVGDFPYQINHFGDWRAVFDYFFPGVIPGSPTSIPPDVASNWGPIWKDVVEAALVADPVKSRQLAAAANYPGTTDAEILNSNLAGARYSIEATNDGVATLGGQPFDNIGRIYLGSGEDLKLNLQVQRLPADPAAVAEMQANYQTTGVLAVPLVTLHTTQDEQVPYRHEVLYGQKIRQAGSQALHVNIPVNRYGHCNFTAGEALVSFLIMVLKSSGQDLSAQGEALLPAAQRPAFRALWRQYRPLVK